MERRKFSREFKLEAVKLVRERGVSGQSANDPIADISEAAIFTAKQQELCVAARRLRMF